MGSSRAAEKSLSDRRLFVPDLAERGASGDFPLSSEAAKHVQVLRLGLDDQVELFDGQGHTCAARIASVSRAGVACSLVESLRRSERGHEVVLVQCLPKGAKLDDIVRMTTELGVTDIRLAVSSRCVSRGADDRGAAKIERLSRIAIEAARQSEQAFVPRISPAEELSIVLARAPSDAIKLACVERSHAFLPDLPGSGAVWVLVGPEGGLSDDDLALIDRAGFAGVGLGRSILRTETAAVVGVSLVLDRLRRRR